jgi:hypothetical protein
MSGPNLVNREIVERMSYKPPVKPISLSMKFNILFCIILFLIPFVLYYFYKTKKTPKQKNKEILEFVKYVKANTKSRKK